MPHFPQYTSGEDSSISFSKVSTTPVYRQHRSDRLDHFSSKQSPFRAVQPKHFSKTDFFMYSILNSVDSVIQATFSLSNWDWELGLSATTSLQHRQSISRFSIRRFPHWNQSIFHSLVSPSLKASKICLYLRNHWIRP